MSLDQHAKVSIVGAGPGDPSLITQKGIWAMQSADVVLYDALAHPSLLAHCPEHVEKRYVGKRKGLHSATQTAIHETYLETWTGQNHIVRLKGGDPVIFGRLGEELAFLQSHDIPVEVVPGVSSGIGVPGSIMMPLTHRALSRSVAFVTGSLQKSTDVLELPVADTLVFFMGVTHLETIVNAALKHEKFSENTPIAILSEGTLSQAKQLRGTLGTILDLCEKTPPAMPALSIMGEVAAFENYTLTKPLSGRRIVLTRALKDQEAWYKTLTGLGAEVVKYPLIAYVPLESRVPEHIFQQPTLILFTSHQAVTRFFEVLQAQGIDFRSLSTVKFGCVGPETRQTLLNVGFKADFCPTTYTSEALLEQIAPELQTHHVLLPQSQKAGTVLKDAIEKRGGTVTHLPCYTLSYLSGNPEWIKPGDWLTFTSPSTVESFKATYAGDLGGVVAFSIGPKTTAALEKNGFSTIIEAPESVTSQMTQSMLNYTHTQ